jgi:hypothetical protein
MESHSSSDVVPISTHGWFAALDERQIDAGERSWIARVTGVHTDGSEWWIQIAPDGDPDRGLVLHLAAYASVSNAVAALDRYARGEIADSRIVDVTQAA